MEIGALASGLIAARAGAIQLAVAARMLRMTAEQGANIAKVIDAAQDNIQRLANVAAGVGGNVDISV
jgi:hypothetical protein